VLSDPKLGRINGWKIVSSLIGLGVYLLILYFLTLAAVDLAEQCFILLLQVFIDLLIWLRKVSPWHEADSQLTELKDEMVQRRRRIIRSNLLINFLVRVIPGSNDVLERTARFLKIIEQPTQRAVFEQVQRQYPKDTVFVVLPMDMGFMDMGDPAEPIERQHKELLDMAEALRLETGVERIIPFYAADPRHPDIVERVRESLAPDKFRGIKIYPNLGYKPDDPSLMEVYRLCMKGNYPVLTHCSPGGIWRYGIPRSERRANSRPDNYRDILETRGYRTLKLCLAHFGGAEEWKKHLAGRAEKLDEEPWVRTVYEMIASEKYPNLYTDISYTVFTPKVTGLYIDLVDYLKVLLTDERVRQRVLFGSDYYMVERESISEKEVSLLLRSRLGEDLYKQIAYTNPREFLGIGAVPPAKAASRKRTARKVR
jgi:predicted TIM-barrel fold metal-dependent hydrolase